MTAAMQEDNKLESEVTRLIIEALVLEDVTLDSVTAETALFSRDGLGLDSIDALELAVAIHKRFGVKIKSNDDDNKNIFASVRSLAQHIARERLAGNAA